MRRRNERADQYPRPRARHPVVLVDGAVAEIVSNPADGVWLFARYLSSPRDPALVGQEEMIFAQDVAAVGDQRMVRP